MNRLSKRHITVTHPPFETTKRTPGAYFNLRSARWMGGLPQFDTTCGLWYTIIQPRKGAAKQ